MNRRQFMRGTLSRSLASIAGAVMARPLLGAWGKENGGDEGEKKRSSPGRAPSSRPSQRDAFHDCIVLGAGMAGMTTARTLRDLDPALSVLVLEGSERLGGRMWTDRERFGGPIELGAEYIHRHRGSVPLWKEVERYGLSAIPVPKRSDGLVYWPDANPPALMNLNELSEKTSLWTKLDMIRIMVYGGHDMSGLQFLDSHHLQGMDRYMVQMALNGHLPAHIDELSMRGYHSDAILQQLREPDDFSVREGFDSLIKGMSDGANIAATRPVEVIRRFHDHVEIACSTGEIFRGRTAVVTFSLNMLRSGKVRFEPVLPRAKQEAIEGLGMRDVAKTIVRFNEEFWPQDMSMLHWPGAGRVAGRTFFHDFYGRPGYPPILTSFMVGEIAEAMQRRSDLEVLQRVCQDLDQVFPRAAPTFSRIARGPDGKLSYFRKHWGLDPWALGGYSFVRYNPGSPMDVEELRRTLKDPSTTYPLFWAGEATSVLTQPASVHGAHSSGLEAAHAVHRYLGRGRNRATG